MSKSPILYSTGLPLKIGGTCHVEGTRHLAMLPSERGMVEIWKGKEKKRKKKRTWLTRCVGLTNRVTTRHGQQNELNMSKIVVKPSPYRVSRFSSICISLSA